MARELRVAPNPYSYVLGRVDNNSTSLLAGCLSLFALQPAVLEHSLRYTRIITSRQFPSFLLKARQYLCR